MVEMSKDMKEFLDMEKLKQIKNISFILCIIGCLIMLYITWNTNLPNNIYFCRNPDIYMNTMLYFSVIFLIGLIQCIILLILYNC